MGPFSFKENRILDLPAPEIHCMAQAIYAEAGGESFDGKRAVGHVIMNRTKEGRFGSSPCIVVKQRGQFVRKTGKGRNWEESLRAAKNLGHDLTSGSLFFKTVTSRVHWNQRYVMRIGGHHFYK